jgi:hypothetical protein
MDACLCGLAPGGPGATGSPLADWVLPDRGLAGVVLSHLAPRDVLGLRASCQAARDAVAGHDWDSPAAAHAWAWAPPQPLGPRVRDAAEWGTCLRASQPPSGRPAADVVVGSGHAALARWRACFPRARGLVVRGVRTVRVRGGGGGWQQGSARWHRGAPTDGCMKTLADGGGGGGGQPLERLCLVRCAAVTDAALSPLPRLVSLGLYDTPSLSGACWAALAGRLRAVATDATGPVTDAHLPALSGCTHVSLGEGASVTDAGVAAHLSARVTHLGLNVAGCAGFDGSCLRSCTRLAGLRLVDDSELDVGDPARGLVPDALAGCAAGLESLTLDGVDGGVALFTAGGGGLPALRRAELRRLPDAAFAGTTPALAELTVEECGAFAGGAGWGRLPGLASLNVGQCDAFTGRALAGGATPALAWLAVRDCPRFAAEEQQGEGEGGGGSGSGAAPPPHPAPLPALVGAYFAGAPALTDAWLAHAPALAHLTLSRCSGVVGGAAALGGRLPRLTHLVAEGCDAFTGAWLGAAGGDGASTRLETLTAVECPALVLADALAPGPHARLWRAAFEGAAGAALTDELLLGGRLPALEVLDVEGCPGFVGGPGLGAALPALTDLDVAGCPHFTGAGLGGLRALARLDVAGCPRVGAAALAAAAAGCPDLASVAYDSRGEWHGGGGSGGGEDAAPLPPLVAPSALGRGWRTVREVRQGRTARERSRVTAWTATRAPQAAAAAPAAASGSGGSGAGGEAPGAKRARAES